MNILVFNSGSSSIKYRLFDMSRVSVIASGVLQRIGESDASLVHKSVLADGSHQSITRSQQISDHRQGMQQINAVLQQTSLRRDSPPLRGIGHRMAHGGSMFHHPTRIDASVLDAIRQLGDLAPLHNPASVAGIEQALAAFPGVAQVVVFDTAFHQTLPPHAYRYAVPRDFAHRLHVRRYGFHGTSYQYVTRQAARRLGRSSTSLNLIALHLGNGSSAAAIRGGISVDTSMGMTPMAGLVMGTRCGDLDPAVVFHLLRHTDLTPDRLEAILNRDSGLLGLCGHNDMREILELAAAGDDDAQQAFEVYVYAIKKYIGAYYAVLGRVDAVLFTGGIGENSAPIRWRVCQGLQGLGIVLDPDRNDACPPTGGSVHAANSPVAVLVEPTDEQLEIAEQTLQTIQGSDASFTPP
ncbi:MAG: acetate kinase [Planctomycetaceae bacterium]|nr:MAG: acetate kinase [Planctomycetaceae bacterium]